MEILLNSALLLHILAGTTALAAGLMAILTAKGRQLHIRSGLIFHYSMLAVSGTALFISVVRFNEFLLLIGIFALYLNISGRRSVTNKSLVPGRFDWLLLLVAAINSMLMLSSGNLVITVFGFINVSLVATDLRIYYRLRKKIPLPKKAWLKRHIGMMMGAFISTLTAFIVVNIRHVEPLWLPWLLPTAVGLPLMAYFTKKYTSPRKVREI